MGEDEPNEEQSPALLNIDLGSLAKPATALVNRVFDVIGIEREARHIVSVAEAEAKADIIRAESQMQVSEIQERGLRRMIVEEGKAQANIESITQKAAIHIKDDAKPDDIEDDWITHFFDRSRLVSDDEMQTLWASILSGEANEPKSFSKRTIDLIATLDKSDAELFTKLCSFVWMAGVPTPMVLDYKHSALGNMGIHFNSLNHLEDIGLIKFNPISKYIQAYSVITVQMIYYGRAIFIKFPNNELKFTHGHVIFTAAGFELYQICTPEPSNEHFDHILSTFTDKGFVISPEEAFQLAQSDVSVKNS